jgi:hypothetical protein
MRRSIVAEIVAAARATAAKTLSLAVPPFITCSAGATALALIYDEQESDSAAAERGP